MLGGIILYGALALITGVAIATSDNTGEWDQTLDDTFPY